MLGGLPWTDTEPSCSRSWSSLAPAAIYTMLSVFFSCCLLVHAFSSQAQTTMSSHAQYYTVSGDEYLFDMRLRQPHSASQAQELEHELHRLSQESQPSRPRSDSSSDDTSSIDERILPSYAGWTNASFSEKNWRIAKPTSSGSNSSTNMNQQSSSANFSHRKRHDQSSSNSSRYRSSTTKRHSQLSTLPPTSMLNRWLDQTLRQDPFHGPDIAGRHSGQTDSGDKGKGKHRAHRN
jgi:hypothetical protein